MPSAHYPSMRTLAFILSTFLSCWSAVGQPVTAIRGIEQHGSQWKLSTKTMQRVVGLENGQFLLKSFKNKVSGQELIPAGALSAEFCFSLNDISNRLSGADQG